MVFRQRNSQRLNMETPTAELARIAALQARPPKVHVVLTGRDAHEKLIDVADTVTEMRKIKHAFDADVPAQRGIEH